MEQLHGGGRQAGVAEGGEGLVGGQPRHGGVTLVRLGDHRVAGGDRGGEVATGDGAIGEGKVGGGQHDHGAEPAGGRADVLRRVDHRHPPAALAGGGGGLPELVERSRHLDLREPGLHRQAGLGMGRGHEFRRPPLEPVGIPGEKGGDRLGWQPRELPGRSRGGLEG